MALTKTAGGRTNLHVWRTGLSYERQKGHLYRREWNNVLFSPEPSSRADTVLRFDGRHAMPFPAQAFDAVYLLHIVEHLTPQETERLLRDVQRILKPSGIVRISTPDLENICRAYLDRLLAYDRDPSDGNLVNYEWAVMELVDQFVRTRTGGLMSEFARKQRYDRAYVHTRFGDVFDEFAGPPDLPFPARTRAERLLGLTPRSLVASIWRRVRVRGRTESPPDPWTSGEINRWLWDRFSLTMMLEKTGFEQVSRKSFRSSDIPEWDRFDFDCSTQGEYPIEPSLYLEARRP